VSYLLKHQGSATWLVAVPSANQGAQIEIATGKAVLAMGGFSGRDPAMTVGKLQELVSSRQLRYVLIGGPGGSRGGGTQESAGSVSAWVIQHCKPVDYAGTGSSSSGLYDCSTAVAGSGQVVTAK
jgi:4-amino-4-deoxy-L-arabinose transferase-like glycosyltransferase